MDEVIYMLFLLYQQKDINGTLNHEIFTQLLLWMPKISLYILPDLKILR